MTDAAQPRTWGRALVLAVLTLWVPALVPYWLGPLTECTHCVVAYSQSLPFVPAVLVPVLLGLDGATRIVVGALVALAMFGALSFALRRLRHPASSALQTIAIVLVGLQAYAFSLMLRM